jgi:pSer/pThr/pTyr-binding forkhead associated (FHA) protein
MQKLDALLTWVTEDGPQIYALKPNTIVTLGRDTENDITIPFEYISRNHAHIEYIGNSYVLSDLGSANGTYVNGTRVGRVPWVLQDGDRIQLHIFRLHFQLVEQPVETESLPGLNKAGLGTTAHLPQTSLLKNNPPAEEGDTVLIQKFGGPDFLPLPSVPSLVASTGLDAGRAFKLNKPVMTVGYAAHGASWEIQLQDPSVSQPHAVLKYKDNGYWLDDLKSEKGTALNGKRITEPVLLKEGDVIVMGDVRMIYRGEE